MTDVWGFRMGSRNAFLMKAIEKGDKSKDAIQADFVAAYPDSASKSTFAVFFTDVVRPLGSASVSRAIPIETNPDGTIRFNPVRANMIKAAISRGLLKEISAVEKNIYPKRDRRAINEVLTRFGIIST